MAKRGLLAFGLWMTALAAMYFLYPSWIIGIWAAIGLSSMVAIGVGVARNRPRRRAPWLLLAGASVAFAAGTVTALVLIELDRSTFPSLADVFMLAGCVPMQVLGLLSLARSGAVIRDRASMIDALILTAGAGFLSWIFLISPYLENPMMTGLQKAVTVAYPLGDVLLLAILARIVITVARLWVTALLLLSGAGLLVSDVLFGFANLSGGWQLGTPVDIGWIVYYAAVGAAALHPSMATLTEPRVPRPGEVNARRAVLGAASLIAPTVLLVQAVRGPVRDGVVIALVSALLVLLAIARMSVVASGLRRTLTREHELRKACESLLSTNNAAQVSAVVHAAVARLLPPDTAHSVVLTVHDGCPRPGEPASQPKAGPTGSDSLITLDYIRSLPAETAVRLNGFELHLHCRLSVGERRIGELYVAAQEQALVALQQALPVLAGQAASMLDHITLNREINRRDSEAYFRTLVLNAADVILIVDADNRINYASPSALPVFGTASLTGVDVLDLVGPPEQDGVAATLAAVREGAVGAVGAAPGDGVEAEATPGSGESDIGTADWTMRHASGEPVEVEVSIRDLRGEPTVGGLVLTMRDVTERRRLERELMTRAYLDPLTGLGNRLRFQDTVHQTAPLAAAGGWTAGVLLINLDDFKVVNDTMGHEVGDELLVAVGRRLVTVLAGRAKVARLGADEFGVVIGSARDAAEIEGIVDELMTAFAEPFLVVHSVVTAQLSIGVATTADAADAQQLQSQADVALGTAKAAGKGRWRRYEASLHQVVIERMQLRTALDQAMADDAFLLHYQPIIDLRSGRTCGLEALIRWEHPTRGMIPPMEFIQIAEESGLIVPLGAWVLRTALAAAARWHREFAGDAPSVSVNVSVRQFRTPGFVERVLAELAESGIPPRQLTLEITESLLLGEQEEIRVDLAALRQAGIKVAIDDFGTGYSSLSYLHRVPVDTLKLDKSFVDTISTSTQQRDLVTGIVQLASTLQLDVVAEGIETATDGALLIDAGCQYGQGYLFARPMGEDDANAWLRANRRAPVGAGRGGA
jgi:diguanylate cyclase (GGDEF)-like protein